MGAGFADEEGLALEGLVFAAGISSGAGDNEGDWEAEEVINRNFEGNRFESKGDWARGVSDEAHLI